MFSTLVESSRVFGLALVLCWNMSLTRCTIIHQNMCLQLTCITFVHGNTHMAHISLWSCLCMRNLFFFLKKGAHNMWEESPPSLMRSSHVNGTFQRLPHWRRSIVRQRSISWKVSLQTHSQLFLSVASEHAHSVIHNGRRPSALTGLFHWNTVKGLRLSWTESATGGASN